MKPYATTLMRGALAAAVALGLVAATATAASAYVVCNANECWHTDARIKLPGVKLTFHNDTWQHQHEKDKHYTWHENDNEHDWHHGYWDHGTWHTN